MRHHTGAMSVSMSNNMDDDVTELVLTPFRDIVDKGKTALANAGDLQPMLKAAQSLLKEGERALKKIEPLCRKNLDEYGASFLAALKENDEIAVYRSEMTDLLWEFDDYIEVDEFDAEKFAQIQALSRKAAPKIYDILMRMKLEAQSSPRDEIRNFMSQLSPPSSPPLHIRSPAMPPQTRSSRSSIASLPAMPPPKTPLPPVPGSSPYLQYRQQRNSVASTVYSEGRSPVDISSIDDATNTLQQLTLRRPSMMDSPALDVDDVADPASAVEEPPLPPSMNPWDMRVPLTPYDGAESPIERRASVGLDESPVLPTPVSPENERRFSRAVPRPSHSRSATSDGGSQDGEVHRRPVSNNGPVYNLFPGSSRARAPTMPSTVARTIPEENPMGLLDPESETPFSPLSAYSQQSPIRQPLQPALNTSENRPSYAGSDSTTSTRQQQEGSGSDFAEPHPGLEVAPRHIAQLGEFEEGLIPVEQESPLNPGPVQMPTKDLTIKSDSSFYIHKGFCEGSKEVLRGGIGVRKTKKPVGFTTAAIVARCTNCLYELDFKNIEDDVNRLDRATFTKSNIRFRLRFLQKCHLPIKRMDDIMYGCIFCIQLGHTVDESDATVFFTTKDLFAHLARHPRPLPDIPGLTVIDAKEVPVDKANDFDIQFLAPPQTNPATENAAFVSQQPAATAREHARRLYGQRLLHDRSAALEMAQGARVTGIEWPEKWNGDWCHGWHDGVHATVPTDILRIEPPPMGQIRMGSGSLIRAKSRWKFSPKDKDKGDWLKFDKGEVITNINWPYPEHWCWSGTNAKGKWGIFPQVFLEPNTVQELSAGGSDRASVLSNEKNKSFGVLGRFASRKQTGRPPSFSGSSSSHETTHLYGR